MAQSRVYLLDKDPSLHRYWAEQNTTKIEEAFVSGRYYFVCLGFPHHIWKSKGSDFLKSKNKCPICNKRILHPDNALSTLQPAIAKEWHPTKNEISANQVIANASPRIVWWSCAENHEWQASMGNRIRLGSGCPYCSGRNATKENHVGITHPHLITEWHESKNEKRIDSYKAGSDYKAWWKCAKGHEWKASLYSRASLKTNCPYCTNQRINDENSLLTLFPEIAKEYNEERNLLKAHQIGAGSLKMAWWKCAENHEWESLVSNRTSQLLSCPVCARNTYSKIEMVLRQSIIESGVFDEVLPHLQRVPVKWGRTKNMSVDIVCTKENQKYAIEYDGSYYHQHKTAKDTEKSLALLAAGYSVIRIRERTKAITLPVLDISDSRYHEILWDYNSYALKKSENPFAETVEEIKTLVKDFADKL